MAKVKANAGAVFERHEKKFMLSPDRYRLLREALAPHMQEDAYGLHTICSLYYDTGDFAVIRHSLDKPAFKEKLRLRSYGVPGLDDTVYMELKKKLAGVTYKRRIPLTLQAAEDYLQRGVVPKVDGREQIFGEVDWFVRRVEPSPRVLLSYDRVALCGREDKDLRITFDAGIRWRDHSLSLARGDFGAPLLGAGMRLMEIKTLKSFPLWLCEILSEAQVYPSSFSKYGTVYRDHIACVRE